MPNLDQKNAFRFPLIRHLAQKMFKIVIKGMICVILGF